MVKNYLNKVNKKVLAIVKTIGQEADRQHQRAYLIGGCVRDILLNRHSKDVDIVSEQKAIVLAQKFARRKKTKLVRHDRFGTASVQIQPCLRVDFALTRQERYPFPGSLPVVSQGTLVEDVGRRDFTINTLALNINKDHFGHLIDVYLGKKDIEQKKIRVLHDRSFEDDPTRILRAVRFEQRFDFAIEPRTLRLLKEALKKNFPSSVKPERYFSEFKKILCEEQPRKPLIRLRQLGALRFLACRNPLDVSSLKRIEQGIKAFKKKKWLGEEEAWVIYLMAVFFKESPRNMNKILARFNLKKSDRKKILAICDAKPYMAQLARKNLKPSDIYRILSPLARESILFLWLCAKTKIVQRRIEQFLSRIQFVKLAINGNDLKKFRKVTGPEIGRVLEEILYKKMDGRVRSKQDEIKFAKNVLV